MFDLGEGSVANYISAGLALNQLDKIFITHLHLDHFGALPWLNMFGGWAPVAQAAARVGHVGAQPGVRHGAHGGGHEADAHLASRRFSVFPVGQGHNIEVHEFDFRTTAASVTRRTASRSSTGSGPTPRMAPRPTGWNGTG